ncbi:MAG: type II toxin-antitoxin system death-on-curing family toxin [Micrococcales bacterium]|nr:type II toxin-antitoxin system death-on-curing family toxin [Micrococcales bacterium]
MPRPCSGSASDLPRLSTTCFITPNGCRRDVSLMEAASARPRTSAFGRDAYPDLYAKAAALLHSLAKNHALVDGNKRLALAAAIAFLGINGERLRLSNDEAYELVMAVAAGEIDELQQIADRLQ